MLKWMFEVAPDNDMGPWVMIGAADAGNINIVQWLASKGYCIQIDTVVASISSGNFDLVKFIQRHLGGWSYEWHKIICKNAAKYGHIEILNWLLDQDTPCVEINQAVMEYAIRSSDMAMIYWAYTRFVNDMHSGITERFLQKMTILASRLGHVPTLKWLYEDLGIVASHTQCFSAAYEQGNLNVLKYLLELR